MQIFNYSGVYNSDNIEFNQYHPSKIGLITIVFNNYNIISVLNLEFENNSVVKMKYLLKQNDSMIVHGPIVRASIDNLFENIINNESMSFIKKLKVCI